MFGLETALGEKGALSIRTDTGEELEIVEETCSFVMADGVPVIELSSGVRIDVDAVVAYTHPIHFPS